MADEDPEISDAQHSAAISARESEVNSFLAKKDKVNALKSSLKSPPLSSKSDEIKVQIVLKRNFAY